MGRIVKDTLREWEVDDVVKVTGNCRGEPSGPTARANYQTISILCVRFQLCGYIQSTAASNGIRSQTPRPHSQTQQLVGK
jgi:hypothetical protein